MFSVRLYVCLIKILVDVDLINGLTWKYEWNGYEYAVSLNNDHTWSDARERCMSEGGDLITIESENEEAHLRSIQFCRYGSRFWIGLNCLDDGENWKWADKKMSNISEVSRWDRNEPGINQFCAYKESIIDRIWEASNCATKKGFICKRVKGQTEPKSLSTTNSASGSCPAGWQDAGGDKCFKAFNEKQNFSWAQANVKCRALKFQQSQLACPRENEVISLQWLVALGKYGVSYWIGLTKYSDGWLYSDNTPVLDLSLESRYFSSACGYSSVMLDFWVSVRSCRDKINGYICQTKKAPRNNTNTPTFLPNLCREGYTSFQQSCYKIFDDKSTFQDSHKACTKEGGFLVDIHNSGENLLIQYLASIVKTEILWIGLVYKNDLNRYQWDNNWYVNYVNWGADQPSISEHGGCVSINSKNGKWSDTNCSSPLDYICKTTTQEPIREPPEKEGWCPNSNWISSGGYCYFACFDGPCQASWTTQTRHCAQYFKDASLSSIHDGVTNDKIHKKLLALSKEQRERHYYRQHYKAWLGLFRSEVDGHWKWADNTPVQYTNWAKDEPSSDTHSNKKCAWMSIAKESPGQWKTGKCMDTFGIICKVEKLPLQYPTPSPVKGSCPNNEWFKYGSNCYLFRPDELVSWSKATDNCQEQGGRMSTLAKITSQEENDFIHHSMLTRTHFPGKTSFWIGLKTQGDQMMFQWQDGMNVSDTYHFWDSSNINEHFTPIPGYSTLPKLCGEMRKESGMWQAKACGAFNGYLCQLDVKSYGQGKGNKNKKTGTGHGQTFVNTSSIVLGVMMGILILIIIIYCFYTKRLYPKNSLKFQSLATEDMSSV